MPQAIGMVDVPSPNPVSWHSEVCDHVVHGIAHGDGGQAVVLGDHLNYMFSGLS